MRDLGLQLAALVARGLFSLEQLDELSPAQAELERDRRRSLVTDLATGWPGRRSPAMRYPAAGTVGAPRNLAREWIEAHPRDWALMLEQTAAAAPVACQRDPEHEPDAAA